MGGLALALISGLALWLIGGLRGRLLAHWCLLVDRRLLPEPGAVFTGRSAGAAIRAAIDRSADSEIECCL
jgi:hypothetical protein